MREFVVLTLLLFQIGGNGGIGGKAGTGGGPTLAPTFTEIQGSWGTSVSSGTTATVTLTSTPTTGNLVVCSVHLFPISLGITSIKDSAGTPNNYTVSTHSPSATQTSADAVFIAYLLNAPAGASSTITVTANGTITFGSFIGCEEFHRTSGTWAFDTDAAGNGAATTAVNAPSITAAASGELEIGWANIQTGMSSANSPWTECTAGTSASLVGACEIILSGTGSATAMNFTAFSSTEWNSMMAAFK